MLCPGMFKVALLFIHPVRSKKRGKYARAGGDSRARIGQNSKVIYSMRVLGAFP